MIRKIGITIENRKNSVAYPSAKKAKLRRKQWWEQVAKQTQEVFGGSNERWQDDQGKGERTYWFFPQSILENKNLK